MRSLLCLPLLLLFINCGNSSKKSEEHHTGLSEAAAAEVLVKDSIQPVSEPETQTSVPDLTALNDTVFVRLADYSDDFRYDLRYATTNNFLKSQVYECPECYVRATTAKALIAVNEKFMEQGYRIKFFDCYRPHDVQKKMWKIMPNPIYVADPAEGSIHNKGGAVDITLETLEGEELPMGTTFDFFGREAHHAYTKLPEDVLKNRKLLKETMEEFGFGSITSEWWHYNYKPVLDLSVANFTWDCPE
ncbi:M15 family metallopeptidase [Robertkochia solimangrovi]|uniref:M15 family metallopeptidase n=1 Tax=Robertkochia solimangrovi TaxID=2213046 RepID=UPI00117D86E4|nr:M15 family metallopeptidase [Robertkochia solimangrovi]TRZ42505.1 peptidase M15 [Robertkochia solimangrovi]